MILLRWLFAYTVIATSALVLQGEASAQDAATLQAKLAQIHSQIAGISVRAMQDSDANSLDLEQRLLDLQKSMHVITHDAAVANLDYLRRTGRNNRSYLVIGTEGDLLDAEADAISSYLDTNGDTLFANVVRQLEQMINVVEP